MCVGCVNGRDERLLAQNTLQWESREPPVRPQLRISPCLCTLCVTPRACEPGDFAGIAQPLVALPMVCSTSMCTSLICRHCLGGRDRAPQAGVVPFALSPIASLMCSWIVRVFVPSKASGLGKAPCKDHGMVQVVWNVAAFLSQTLQLSRTRSKHPFKLESSVPDLKSAVRAHLYGKSSIKWLSLTCHSVTQPLVKRVRAAPLSVLRETQINCIREFLDRKKVLFTIHLGDKNTHS